MAEATTASTASGSNTKINALLAWIFAPITSLIWMNEKDDFLKYHAKQSLAWSITAIVGHVLCGALMIVFIGMCLWPIWLLIDVGVRIYGAVKANNGEKWEVPVVGGLIK